MNNKKNNCHTCKFRSQVPGSAHSVCGHPMFDTLENKMAFALMVASGKLTGLTATDKDGHTWDMMTFNPIGVRGGLVQLPYKLRPRLG